MKYKCICGCGNEVTTPNSFSENCNNEKEVKLGNGSNVRLRPGVREKGNSMDFA